MTEFDDDKLLTEKELGIKAGFNSGWPIRNFRINGKLPYIKVNNRIFYRWSTYLKWLADKENTSVSKDEHVEYGKLRRID